MYYVTCLASMGRAMLNLNAQINVRRDHTARIAKGASGGFGKVVMVKTRGLMGTAGDTDLELAGTYSTESRRSTLAALFQGTPRKRLSSLHKAAGQEMLQTIS